MEKLKAEIARIKRHNLDYYQSHLDLVEDYIEEKPDISIETCKALIEGISKLTLFLLAQRPVAKDSKDFSILVRAALDELQKGRGYSDVDCTRRLAGVIHYIGEVRNSHCDIGHGRASLKDQVNDEDFAELIIGITDHLCTYMLRRLDMQSEKEMLYENNPLFNTQIDERYATEHSKVRYSKALFEQEFETYEIMLDDYLTENDNALEQEVVA